MKGSASSASWPSRRAPRPSESSSNNVITVPRALSVRLLGWLVSRPPRRLVTVLVTLRRRYCCTVVSWQQDKRTGPRTRRDECPRLSVISQAARTPASRGQGDAGDGAARVRFVVAEYFQRRWRTGG